MSISMVLSDKTACARAEQRGRSAVTALLGALFALLVVCACAPAAYAEDGASGVAANQVNTVELNPDGYYNASEAPSQTLVRISEPGTYALLGSSSLVRVVVDPDPGDEIRVYLLNGLTLSPSSGAAITVASSYDSEKQSHVELVLGAGAKVNLSSGSTAALSAVLDPASVTPPSSDPMVTITAQDSRGTLNLKSSTKSGDGAPGLWADGISGVNIAGGTVTATGGGTAPGIGGAHSGSKVMISD